MTGCGGGQDATEKQLSELRAELLKVRADNAALAERLDGVELRAGPRAAPPAAAPVAEAGAREQPELDVVRLMPEGAAPSEDPAAEGPRPMLRGTGKIGTVEEVPGARPGPTQGSPPKVGGPASKSQTKSADAASPLRDGNSPSTPRR